MRSLAFVLLVACSSTSDTPPAGAPATVGGSSGLASGASAAAGAPPARAFGPIDPAIIAKRWPDGCFVVRDGSGTLHTSHAQRCATPRRPYSTFKIANALIAVELGLLANADAAMTWDKRAVPDQTDYLATWRTPHTLRSGMAVSAVPYFRTLALQIGEARMHAGLTKLAYGNRDLAGGLSRFWLTRGGLRISASEQLAFVEALARGTLPFGKHAQATVGEILELARTPDGQRRLYGKTGSGPIEDARGGWLVWQVGWVLAGDERVPYAAWLDVNGPASGRGNGPTMDEARALREQRLRTTLAELGLFP